MWLKDKGYVTSRWNDFGGWLNLRMSSDSIDDKQNIQSINMVSEGNKLVTSPWYVDYYTPWTTVAKWQWISLYSDYIFTLQDGDLYVFNTSTQTTYSQTSAVSSSTDSYKIINVKSFSWNISIIMINVNSATTEDIKGYEFNTTTHAFTSITFTWLSDKNFKCGIFFEWKLLLGWNPSFPSSLYYSKTWSVATPTNIYDFSGYSSNAQNIGDWEPLTWFVENNWTLFIFKSNSVFQVTWVNDTGADAISKSFAYVARQLAAAGAINQFCAIPVEQDVMYFDGVNLRRVSYEANMAALSDDSVSKDIEEVFKTLPSSQSSVANMYYSYPFVKLFLRDKFSNNASIGVCYNVVDKSYSIQSGIEVIQWVGGFVDNKRTAYFITSLTSTVYKDWVSVSYNGGNIFTSHKSKRYVLGDWVDYKRISQVELYWKVSPLLRVYIDLYVNWVLVTTREIYKAEVLAPTTGWVPTWNSLFGANAEWMDLNWLQDYVERYELFNDGRDFSFWIRSNWQGKFELHWLNLMYKSIKAYDLHS